MRHAHRMASLAALTLVALAPLAAARADGIASYKLVDLGSNPSQTDVTSPTIDESGNLTYHPVRDTGAYTGGGVFDPQNNGHQLYEYVYKNGSDMNLLPPALQDPSKSSLADVNSSGLAIGNSLTSDQPYIYSAATGQYLDVKWLPGQTQAPGLQAINNLGQMIGYEDQAIFYSSPTAVPVPLTDLLPVPKGWSFEHATDINGLGEIVGSGVNPSGQFTDFELVPIPAPEPTTLALLCLSGLLYGGRRTRSRNLPNRSRDGRIAS